MGELPNRIGRRHAVVIGSGTRSKWLVFDCPCGRGHQVMVSIDPDNRPTWRIIKATPLTLWPSVDEISHVGRCHYVIRDGRVHWVERTTAT